MTTSPRPDTRQALLVAASQMLAAGQEPSLAEIATAAGVGRATLHRHFPSRQDLMRALADWALDTLDDAAEAAAAKATSHTQALWAIVEAMIPLGDRYHILIHAPLAEGDTSLAERLRQQESDMVSLIRSAQDEGAFRPGLPATWISAVLDALIYTAWEQVQRGELAANAAGPLLRETLLSGCGDKP